MRWRNFMGLVGATTFMITNPVFMSPEPPLYQIIRGQYQDKIRRFSPPQKVFNVFASAGQDNKIVMSPIQLLRAICFYNYSETSQNSFQGFDPVNIKKFLGKQKDYEIYDYFNFGRFVTFTKALLLKFCQESGIDQIDKTKFIQLMKQHVCKDYTDFIKESIGLQSRQFKPSKQSFNNSIQRMADSLFNDKYSYSIPQFIQLRRQLMTQIYKFQFRCFKTQDNKIDGVDFARSIIKYVQSNQKIKFLRRVVEKQKQMEPVLIGENEYVNFHFMLQVNHRLLQNLLNKKGAVNRQDVRQLFKRQVGFISDGPVEVFFDLLDTDDSGFIEKRQVLGVISDLGYYWRVKSGDLSLQEMLHQRWQKFKSKFNRIHSILIEQ